MKIRIALILILGCWIWNINAQHAPGLEWKKTFDDGGKEVATDVISTLSGDLAMIGNVNETYAFWRLIDKNGKVILKKSFKNSTNNQLNSILQTREGFFALAGYQVDSSNQKMAWLTLLNNSGQSIFSKKIKSKHRETVFTDMTYDGENFYATGYATTPRGKELWVCSLDKNGEILWEKLEGRTRFSEGTSISILKNDWLAVSSKVIKNGKDENAGLFLLKKNSTPILQKKLPGRNFKQIEKVLPTPDGGLFFTGSIKSTKKNRGNGKRDIWVGKMDENLKILWQKTIGGRRNENGFGMTLTSDDGIVIVGNTFSHGVDFKMSKGFVVKLTQNGGLMWLQEPPFGGSPNDALNAITEMQDGSLVMVGSTASKNEDAKNQDAWAIKIYHEHRFQENAKPQLKITNLSFPQKNNILKEGNATYLETTIINESESDAYEVQLLVEENHYVKGVEFIPIIKVGFLAAGDSTIAYIPIQGATGLELGDAQFLVKCTDASRQRTEGVTLNLVTSPKVIPSNFLQIRWVTPNAYDFPNRELRVKRQQFKIQLEAKSDRRLKRKFFTILLNGKPYQKGQKSGEVSLNELEQNRSQVFTYQYEREVTLQKGINRIEVIIENGKKKASSGIFYLNYSDKPNLHILAIGIGHDDLDYTTNDALDFANSFKDQSGKIFETIYVQTLISGRRNKDGIMETSGEQIKKTFQELSEKYQHDVYDRDYLMVFISSHGKNINGQFKILPSDFELMGEEVLVDFQNDIIEKLQKIKCQKLLLIDACQSGSSSQEKLLGVSNNQKSVATAISNFSQQYFSVNTLASCAADEYSWEDPAWANGAFTEAMLGAFTNEVYEDESGRFRVSQDNIITFGELYQYIQRRVPQMLENINKEQNQHPSIENTQLELLKDVPIYQMIDYNGSPKKIAVKR